VLPQNLDAEVINAAGDRIRPVMIHHAVLGSFERFIAMLLEHHRGSLPFWLAPEQIVVMPVAAAQEGYARQVATAFDAAGLRCLVDDSAQTLARRIVSAHEQGIPLIAIAGAREMAAGSVSLRQRGGQQSERGVADAAAWLTKLQTGG
jgi:threonyl-tRNA synthetase